MSLRPRHRAFGYVRVSSCLGRSRLEAFTEEIQLEKIRQWCAVADLELVEVLRDWVAPGEPSGARVRT